MNIAQTQKVAQSIMQNAFGAAVKLENGRKLENQSNVLRFYVLGGVSGAPGTVVTKRPRGNRRFSPSKITRTEHLTGPIRGFYGDWAGGQFLTEIQSRSIGAPRFYGGDLAANVIAIEDLGDMDGATRADHLLLGRRTVRPPSGHW